MPAKREIKLKRSGRTITAGDLEVLIPGEAYSLTRFMAMLDLTDASLRDLRELGLPVTKAGMTSIFSGRSVIEWFEGQCGES